MGHEETNPSHQTSIVLDAKTHLQKMIDEDRTILEDLHQKKTTVEHTLKMSKEKTEQKLQKLQTKMNKITTKNALQKKKCLKKSSRLTEAASALAERIEKNKNCLKVISELEIKAETKPNADKKSTETEKTETKTDSNRESWKRMTAMDLLAQSPKFSDQDLSQMIVDFHGLQFTDTCLRYGRKHAINFLFHGACSFCGTLSHKTSDCPIVSNINANDNNSVMTETKNGTNNNTKDNTKDNMRYIRDSYRYFTTRIFNSSLVTFSEEEVFYLMKLINPSWQWNESDTRQSVINHLCKDSCENCGSLTHGTSKCLKFQSRA